MGPIEAKAKEFIRHLLIACGVPPAAATVNYYYKKALKAGILKQDIVIINEGEIIDVE